MTVRKAVATAGERESCKGGLERQEPFVMSWRVDAFYLAFQGVLREAARAQLEVMREKGEALKTETAIELVTPGGTLRGALSTRSRDGWWLIYSAWMTVTIEERASHGWTIAVQPSALLLLHEGPRAALTMAREAAQALLGTVLGERVRRLDLAADGVGFDVRGMDPLAFSVHHRTRYKDIAKLEKYYRRGIRTGFMFGKGDAVVRIYDKTEHLAIGLDDTKADDERAVWRMAGWNGRDDVTRVEFQLRGRLLDEMDLRDPEKALDRLDAVWSYCTKKWMRLVELGTSTRKDRCRTDPRWEALERVVFRERTEPAKRARVSPVPQARRMISAVVNYCACIGILAGIVGADARARVANWSNERAEAWIQMQLFEMAKHTTRAATSDLIARFEEPRDAAAHLMEKMSAASSRFSIVERGELAVAA